MFLRIDICFAVSFERATNGRPYECSAMPMYVY